ncbi:MAG: hypothetical protein AAGB14_08770, partial [Verrucomicrobiota bacterium]
MDRIALICICLSLPFFSGCDRGGSSAETEASSEAIRSIMELRSRLDLSDDEIIRAIERLAKTEAFWKEAIEEGLTTEEELAQMHASMPETLRKLDDLRSEMLGQDAMAAAVSLATLRHYHDDSIDNALPTLRYMVANYYRSIRAEPTEQEAGFIARV